jgi:hypothetical protein
MPVKSFLFCLFFPGLLFSQEPKTILTAIDHISISRQGNVFAATEKGDVLMLDSTGKTIQNFSPRRPARIHLLEAWNGLRIFAFNRDFQNYFILDRFLLSDGPSSIERAQGYARLMAPAQDGNIWLLDEASFELRKTEMSSGRVLFSTPLNLILQGRPYEFSFMREYQNQLYLADKQGPVLVFDLNGNFRQKLPLQNCSWFGFDREELLSIQNGEIVWYHPFRLSIRKKALPESMKSATELLFLSNRVFCLQKGTLYNFEKAALRD